jgi:hypothetical protein
MERAERMGVCICALYVEYRPMQDPRCTLVPGSLMMARLLHPEQHNLQHSTVAYIIPGVATAPVRALSRKDSSSTAVSLDQALGSGPLNLFE